MSKGATRWGPPVGAAVRAVWRHPRLWPVGLATVRRLARPGWWHRWPLLPVPDEAYWRFRLVTAYGGDGRHGAPRTDDIVSYLEWCRRSRPGRG